MNDLGTFLRKYGGLVVGLALLGLVLVVTSAVLDHARSLVSHV